MLTVRSTMWNTEDQYNEYYLNQLKEILEDPKYGNKGKFVESGWMERVAMGLKKSPIPLISGLMPFVRPKEILPSSQLSRPMFVGLEMKGIAGDPVWQKVNPDKIRNNPSNSYLNHGDPEGKQYSVGEPMSLFAPAGSTMTIKSLSPCAN